MPVGGVVSVLRPTHGTSCYDASPHRGRELAAMDRQDSHALASRSAEATAARFPSAASAPMTSGHACNAIDGEDLSVEMLRHVFGYLDARTTTMVLPRVCRHWCAATSPPPTRWSCPQPLAPPLLLLLLESLALPSRPTRPHPHGGCARRSACSGTEGTGAQQQATRSPSPTLPLLPPPPPLLLAAGGTSAASW